MDNMMTLNQTHNSSTNKRKHVTLTLYEKLKIIELCEKKEQTKAAIAQSYGIGRSTVSDIFSNRESIKAFVSLHDESEVGKRRKLDKFYMVATSTSPVDSMIKRENDETLVDTIEDYEYQEMDPNYEIVYDNSSMNVFSSEKMSPKEDDKSAEKKRKSKTLTFKEKYEIIQQIEAGVPVTAISSSYGVGKTTIYDFLKRKEEIIAYIDRTNDLERRTFKGSRFPEIEERVLSWCESKDTFTKDELFDFVNQVFEELKSREQPVPKNGFCRSTWSKRFFSRNPQVKPKVVTKNGDPDEFLFSSMFMTKYKDTSRESLKSKQKIITYGEKIHILNQIEAGKDIEDIADDYGVEREIIEDIYDKRDVLRNIKLPGSDLVKRRTIKGAVKHPQLEYHLLQWCLSRKIFPSDQDIVEKSAELFSELSLHGEFHPNVNWAKRFVMRHQQLRNKQGIVGDMEYTIAESFIEHDTILPDDEEYEYLEESEIVEHDPEIEGYEEYIVEELDDADTMESDYTEIESKTELDNKSEIVLISDDSAIRSINLLLKYCEQRGHDSIYQQLDEYKNYLENDNNDN